MDTLKIPSSSPSILTQIGTPNSPRRHIHSSFPYYFYTTPSTPQAEGLSAFVTSCESRLGTIQSNLDTEEPDFKFHGLSISFKCTSVALATAEDLSHNDILIPSEPLTPSPLKLPPRLQFIKNIRKSLRNTQSFKHRRLRTKLAHEFGISKDQFDPFTAAMETVRKEPAPWCQILKKQHRRIKSFEHVRHESDQIWERSNAKVEEEDNGGERRLIKKRPRILSYFKGATASLGKHEGSHHETTKPDTILEGSDSGKTATSCESEGGDGREKSNGGYWKKAMKKIQIFEFIKNAMKGKRRLRTKFAVRG